ncbi:bromodomain-containing protein 4 [Panicum miliaceum]|uniref:Bromodomain-containing protein 4 n=1 Tax=Panicum miliaceum TaxID=4540 RepID=A0A3L6Q6I5_PANMI|nr:bromodomain-containing protein 4 [Panicum miliaceum]
MGRTKQSPSSSSFWSSRRRASSAPATPRPEPASAADPPIGCMSMVHYLIFAPGAGCVGRPPSSSNAVVVTPHGFLSPRRDDSDRSKSGFEAPRNSLDLDADNPNDIQIGVQIEPVFDALARTNMRRPRPTAPSSEAETPRTPSLVARLMGIDGLPDSQQPSPSAAHHKKQPAGSRQSSKKQHAAAVDNKENHCCSAPASAGNAAKAEKKKRVIPESMNREPLRSLSCNVAGGDARSLPDTPRGSTSARASWDGPRLSLQALKESVLDRAAQYMSMPSSPTSSSAGTKKNSQRRRRDERERERVAKEHAREILWQAKENVASRKSSSKSKSKSSSPAVEKRHSIFNNKENVPTSPAAAPAAEDKLVVVQAGKPMLAAAKAQQGTTEHPPSESPRVPLAPRQPPPPQRAKPSRPPPPLDPPTRARKPDGCERFATRIKKPAAAGGQAPASASPVALPSAPASSSGSALGHQQRHGGAAVPLEEDPEYSYLRTVLERGRFMRSPPPRRTFKGHSVSSPVDPIVFHLLELELPADEARLGPLRHRWNRKLLFHLAQELLADLLLGLDEPPPPPSGPPLLGKVWRKVRSFPAADCRVVGDIDALVASDLEAARVRRLARHPAVAEEAGDVAEEVAELVLEALLGECVAEESGSLVLSPPACAGCRA